MTAPRPLGYWVKTVDRLIEGEFDAVAGELGLARNEWQVLQRLSVGAEQASTIEESLAPYCGPGQGVEELLRPLVKAGLVEHRADEYRLTDDGEQRTAQVRDQAMERVNARVADGIPVEDQETLLRTLEQVAKNLGGTAP